MARIISGGGGKLLTTSLIPWYRAGGCPAPIAVWQPKAGNGWNPANLAGSYVNRVFPGTYDAAPGTAPAWAAATGWTFTAASLQYLKTGVIVDSQSWSFVARYSGSNGALFGAFSPAFKALDINPTNGGGAYVTYSNVNGVNVAPQLVSGTAALCGRQGYRNGAAEGVLIAVGAQTFPEIYIAAFNFGGSVLGPTTTMVMTAFAIWNVDVGAYAAAHHTALVAAGL